MINSNELGEKPSKADIEILIVANGGKKVQNLMTSTTHIIAFKDDFRVHHIVQKLERCVISFKWVLKCIKQGKLVELTPDMLVYSNDKLMDYF